MTLSPIILFVYNRPKHTLQTLEALQKNTLSDQSELYIYADGARENANEKDLSKIKKVREIIRQKKWCHSVEIIENKTNQGLAKSIIKGVSEVIERHGRAIILEDDIVTSKGFLTYMNDALNFYENQKEVMHVAGYFYPVKTKLPSTFFYENTSCWGWSTWHRAWQHLNLDATDLLQKIEQKNATHHFNINGTYDFTQQLKDNINGALDTWAIYWYTSVYLRGGLCLHPHQSLVQNVGFDGTGEHCSFNTVYHVPELAQYIPIESIPLEISQSARTAMMDFYNRATNPPLHQRIYRKFVRLKNSVHSR